MDRKEDAPSPCEEWAQPEYALRDVTHRAARELSENPDVTWSTSHGETHYYVKDHRPREFVCQFCGKTFPIKEEAAENCCIPCWMVPVYERLKGER